jgi:hypothetical protein
MHREDDSAEQTSSGSTWGLRNPGLSMGTGSKNIVKEFTGMWALKPDADLEALTKALTPGGWINPPGESFAHMTTLLGLIRAARWFVARTPYFDGYTLFFVSQFDGSVEKYFDDFVLNGRDNLAAVWGQCVGCPTGPEASAHDLVEFIARGQIKTLACYDAYPSLSHGQIHKMADWYGKTQRFQRTISAGRGNLDDNVNAFLAELAEPYKDTPSEAVIDEDVAREWQYEDIAERFTGTQRPKAA